MDNLFSSDFRINKKWNSAVLQNISDYPFENNKTLPNILENSDKNQDNGRY